MAWRWGISTGSKASNENGETRVGFAVFGHQAPSNANPASQCLCCALCGLRPSKQYKESQYDVAKNPKSHEHSGPKCCADSSPSLLCVTTCGISEFANASEVAKQPYDHDDIETDKQPFNELSKNAPLWFTELNSAFWTLERSIAYFVGTLRTIYKRHLLPPFLISGYTKFLRSMAISVAFSSPQSRLTRPRDT